MIRNILAAGALVAIVGLVPGASSAQESCADYMEVVRERLTEVPADKNMKAMEHFAKAEAAREEDNEETCIEELQLANQEIDAL